jgi:hypothetical protein
MIKALSVLLVLLVAKAVCAFLSTGSEARISLFEPAKVSHADRLTSLDCRATKPSESIYLGIDTCLWSDYYLVNNFKIAQFPFCPGGRPATVLFYEGTSCTGNPTFRSDQSHGGSPEEITDRCLFGSSPKQWSLVFRCADVDSQSISKGRFRKAVPPSYETSKINKPNSQGGVLTLYESTDCTIYRPKQPTFLDADVCLPIRDGDRLGSIHITQPVVCGNGKAALTKVYEDEECETWTAVLGSDAWTDSYYASLDKKCHTTTVRSISFFCGAKHPTPFDQVPPHRHEDVEQLILLDPTPEPEPEPEPEPQPKPAPKPNPVPSSRYALVTGYTTKNCTESQGLAGTVTQMEADTCVSSVMYRSLHIQKSAICSNGTQALLGVYSRPGCHPEDMTTLQALPSDYSKWCGLSTNTDSLVFWCEGLPESEIGGKQGSVGGLVKLLLLVLLIVIVFIALAVLSCVMRGAAMMQQANRLLQRIKALFGKDEGLIQLEDEPTGADSLG